MKQKKFLNNEVFIIVKLPEDNTWYTNINNIQTPTVLTFALSANDPKPNIKKISWDLGNGNQVKNITNRKMNLYEYHIDCKYRKTHNTTIYIQATACIDETIFITQPIITSTSNIEIKKYYVQPEEFKNQILKYYKTNNFTDDIADSINKIANRLAFAPNFINYSYREEMIGDAIVRMVEALTNQKFDPEKGNPFSYFTKIAFHAFCNRIKKEKRAREALTKLQNETYDNMIDDGLLPQPHGHIHNEEYELNNENENF